MPTEFTPSIEYGALAPITIVLFAGVFSTLIEAFLPRGARRTAQLVLVFSSLLGAFGFAIFNSFFRTPIDPMQTSGLNGLRQLASSGSVAIDGPGLFLQSVILVVALVGALLLAERQIDPQGDAFAARASALPGSEDERQFTNQGWLQTEIWPLFLFAVGGMVLFPVANDLLTMFVALEVLSLPLYLLASMARRRRLLSQEASLKYFVLGAFSSAFFLFGSALIYAATGTMTFGEIFTALGDSSHDAIVLTGIGMIAVGLLFKVGAAPFHQWTPDVYQGSPTALVAFMAAATKVAAFGALLRLFYVAFGPMRWDWRPMMWAIAIASMLLGSLLAVTQTDIKRMLAYSSVAHSGFLLLGVTATSRAGIGTTLFYLLAYAFTTLGSFAIVSLVRDPSGEATHLSNWAGLGKKSPVVAGIFAFFLLSLAGIPLTSGFTAKFAIFGAAIEGGATALVIVAVVSSAIAAFFYARIIVLMFFTESADNDVAVVVPSMFTKLAVALSFLVTLLLGILPEQILELASRTGIFIR